jgi:chorismate synthase
MLRFLTAGESHGPGLVTIVEGLPKGLHIDAAEMSHELARRRMGYGRSRRMKIEEDRLEILAGIRFGRTLGSPVAVLVHNTEWPQWQEVMSVDPGERSGGVMTRPRPGHADLAGMLKYGTDDARDILERASARETAARTVAGVLAKKLLAAIGVEILSHVTSIGDVDAQGLVSPGDSDKIDANEVRCIDAAAAARMVEAIDRAREAKDTLGGVFEVIAHAVPAGIGSHVHHDRRLDGMLAAALMSVPGIKGVEIGDGFAGSRLPGSKAHDEIRVVDGLLGRASNHAGGIEGGMTNGEPVRARAAMKPLPTLMQPLATIDMATGDTAGAARERSDVCAVPAAAVVGEQMMALVLAPEVQRKFGGDTVEELKAAVDSYRARVDARP